MKTPVLTSLILGLAFCLLVFILGTAAFLLEPLSVINNIDSGLVLGAYERRLGSQAPAEPDDPVMTADDNVYPPQKLDEAEAISLIARSGVAMDSASNIILYAKAGEEVAPIASITKLMTALVFIDSSMDWEKIYEITLDDRREGGRIYLVCGDKVKIKDLFYFSLVGSANTATMALVHATGMSEEEFVTAMNEKAQALGLANTYFIDPIGLGRENVSTAAEIARLAQRAFQEESIREATLQPKYECQTQSGRAKLLYNTDDLLIKFPQNGISLLGGKTGYTKAAGYCFAALFTDEAGHDIISVVLGSDTSKSRFTETKKIIDWVYENYSWQ